MSIRALTWAMKLPVKPSAKKFVLIVLADYSTDTGKAYPTIKTISAATALGPDAVNTQLDALCADGIITDTGQRVGELKDTKVFQLNPVQELELKPKEKKQRLPKSEALQEADQIYQLYPRKIGRPKALTAIARCIKLYGFEAVRAGTELFSKTWTEAAKDISYCPHAATFFNQERFNDSPEAWGLATAKKIAIGPPYADVLAFATEKETDIAKATNWAVSFHAHWKQRKWQRDGREIDWKVEFQNQIGKWRGTPK